MEGCSVSQPKFFRAYDDDELGDRPRPAPGDWFGSDDNKFRSASPAFSEQNEGLDPHGTDGWRDFFQGHPRDPLWNPLLSPDKKQETIKFKNENNNRALVYVLEQAAEIFEAAGHDDLAAECEIICETLCSEI
jgi:hypothetical protein